MYSNKHASGDNSYDESRYRTPLSLILNSAVSKCFSAQSIKDANPALRMAMEDVAGTAEKLAKDKAAKDPPPPFRKRVTPSIYS